MATLLSKTKSSVGSPYVYYQLDYSTSNRTGTSIDINVTCNSNLASSSSSLGTGSSYGINGYLTINGNTYSWVIKPTNQSWSGTSNHTSYTTITAPVGSSDTTISGITFQAIRSNGSTSNAGYLSPVGCNNVTFESFHTPPLISGYTITEANSNLTSVGLNNNVFVANLSQKQININYTLYDGATFTRASVYNGMNYNYLSDTLPVTIDFKQNVLYTDTNGVPMFVRVTDSQGGATYYTNNGQTSGGSIVYDYYSFIPYTKPTIIGSAKRVGQISGQVAVSCNGTIYNGTIGNVTTTKPTIVYSYYEYPNGTIKTGTIPSSSITLSGNTFSVSNYNIGSTSTSATNYFDPEKAYRITINVADSFTGNSQTISFSNTNSSELPIAVGEATWTEYKDRVDFKKITINGGNIVLNSNGIIKSKNIGMWHLADTMSFGSSWNAFVVPVTDVVYNNTDITLSNNEFTIPSGVSLIKLTFLINYYNVDNRGDKICRVEKNSQYYSDLFYMGTDYGNYLQGEGITIIPVTQGDKIKITLASSTSGNMRIFSSISKVIIEIIG